MKDKSETGTDHDDCDGGGGRRMHRGNVRRLRDVPCEAHRGHGATFDTEARGEVRQDAIGEFLGQFPKGEGGGEAEGASAGVVGKKNAPSRIDTFLRGCGFYELFLV